MRLWSSAKNRATRMGITFNITPSDIVVPTHCPVLGIALDPTYTRRTDNSPSVDRAVPSLGYIKENVVVISWRANRLKNNATVDELRRIASFYDQFVPHVGGSNAEEDH